MARIRTPTSKIVGPVVNFKETDLGFEYKDPKVLVFFGKKDSGVENLKTFYPNFDFKMLWQIHSDLVVHTTPDFENNSVKADSQWTEDKNVALVSKSADCMPVLAINQSQDRILAVHAGWRGIQNRIIPKSIQKLGPGPQIFIGPHILKNSFEIKNDCFELLSKSTQLHPNYWYQDNHADLYEIAINQIAEKYEPGNAIHSLLFDTKTDLRFHSFRRDGQSAGRQNSFIVLL